MQRVDANGTKVVVIAGAGPAGLTAALELLRRSDVVPLIFESDVQVGGISKTINFEGNRMDLGGHRFFSKSDWVMKWWQEILPVQRDAVDEEGSLRLTYQRQTRDLRPVRHEPDNADAVMLIRQRLSRIFYGRRFFDYPLTLSARTILNMGVVETARVGLSYGRSQLKQRDPESSLEDFLINRFGARLYRTFFKSYTEKVWGVSCDEISAEWGAQRIKGLSIKKALTHALLAPFRTSGNTSQKHTETSLIERFLYPKFGPGQMWEEVARKIAAKGGEVFLRHRVVGIERAGRDIKAVTVKDLATDQIRRVACDNFISTLPIQDLARMLQPEDPQVVQTADRLPYRDFMTAGLLVRRMRATDSRSRKSSVNGMPPDNWIYIQEPDVKIGRLQIFNNWSPALVKDPDTIWLGLEYFCREGDDLWSMNDDRFVDFAAEELEKIGLIDRRDVLAGTLVRVPKAYPAYFGEYRNFGRVRSYLDEFRNLYPIGRNGMHRYNNQDHSMLAADCAVKAILSSDESKSAMWSINAEDQYHEELDEIA